MTMDLINWGISVFSIMLAIIFYFKGKKEKVPTYEIRCFPFIKEKIVNIDDIKIFYKDQPIKKLSVTILNFTNNGRDLINKGDVVDSDRLRLVANNGCLFLSACILTGTNINNPSAIIKNNVVEIDFDYLAYGDVFDVLVYHNGDDSDVSFHGTIKGCEILDGRYPRLLPYIRFIFALFLVASSLTLLLLIIFSVYFYSEITSHNAISEMIISLFAMGFLVLVFLIGFLITSRSRILIIFQFVSRFRFFRILSKL